MTTSVCFIGTTLKFDDGTTLDINEGDIIHGLVYKDGAVQKTIDEGAVRVIVANTKNQSTGATSCPPIPYVYSYITPTTFIIDSSEQNNAILTKVAISSIVKIDSVTAPDFDPDVIVMGAGPQFKSLDTVIADAEDGAVIQLTAGVYDMPLNITKGLSLIGEDGVVMKGKLTVDAPEKAVVLSGLELTDDAIIVVNNASTFAMDGCTFGGHNLTEKTMPVAIKAEGEMLVKIIGNTFQEENQFSYNLIDVYAQLADGSVISDNKFEDKCCVHNQISLYGIAPNAVIDIDNNYAAKSVNMLRIGFKGNPSGVVNLVGNAYDETDDDPAWAGLFLVQPYGCQTESFAGITLNIEDTAYPTGTQIGYLYAGANDTPWSDSNKPKAYLEGEAFDIPDSSV